ncbi:MAG: type II toxin-antitoxin system PemK/MazF family toxin [Acidobacteria bacterium]|nr:type II toxin-antitoxin system PemK/MazF family toxin [Acidobacteriota bacterium]
MRAPYARIQERRPVLIITRDSVLQYLGEVTVAPITSIVRDIPSEVLLSPQDGMARDCAVNCDHLQTVSKGKLGSVIATLPSGRMVDVAHAIRFALNL